VSSDGGGISLAGWLGQVGGNGNVGELHHTTTRSALFHSMSTLKYMQS